MTAKTITRSTSLRTATVDALLLGTALLIPTLSHLTALPLYRLNPMLLILLSGIMLVDKRNNSLVLAILLPLTSTFITGMPTLAKAICMAAELSALTLIYSGMSKRRTSFIGICASIVVAMLGAKTVYYLLKSILVSGPLVDTAWSIQLFTMAGYSLLFAGAMTWRHRSQDRQCGRDRC